MKINIELNMPDERMFLNFWNFYNGDDVVCELKEGKLMLCQHNEEGDELPSKEITIEEFLLMVKSRAEEIYKTTT